jgi:hypothetical protein
MEFSDQEKDLIKELLVGLGATALIDYLISSIPDLSKLGNPLAVKIMADLASRSLFIQSKIDSLETVKNDEQIRLTDQKLLADSLTNKLEGIK